jgi:large subunit ribosomal protein L19
MFFFQVITKKSPSGGINRQLKEQNRKGQIFTRDFQNQEVSMHPKIAALESELKPKKDIPQFFPGDEIEVHVKVREGEKTRTQIFTGTCIARKGTGIRETFTVRKISYGEGVERIFPIYSSNIVKIKLVKSRKDNRLAPRAKMYYLRKKNK